MAESKGVPLPYRRPGRPSRARTYAPRTEYPDVVTAEGTRPIWLYLRLSRAAGDEHDAIARQRLDLTRKLTSEGWTIVGEFVDNDSASASAVRTRKGWSALNQAIDNGEIGALGFWKLDRLTRIAVESMGFLSKCRAKAVHLVSYSDSSDELNSVASAAKLVNGIKALIAEGETETMSERQKAAKRHAAEGGFHHGGQRPFGWQVGPKHTDALGRTGSRLVPHPIEFPALEMAVEMTLRGDSLASISRAWRDQFGITTQAGSPVYVATILRVLRSPRLLGYRMRNVPEHRRGVQINLMDYIARDANGKPAQSHQGVVDRPTWIRLQRALDEPRASRTRLPWGTSEWLLTGRIYCATCEGPMHGHVKGDKVAGKTVTRRVYRCNSNRRVGAGACVAPATIAQHLADGFITGYLESYVSPDVLARARARRGAAMASGADLEQDLAEARVELAELVAKQGTPAWRGTAVSAWIHR